MKPALTAFRAEFAADGAAVVWLERTTALRLLGRAKVETLLFDDWAAEAPPAALSAVGVLQGAWAEDAKDVAGTLLVAAEGQRVRLAPAMSARLTDAQAVALGLPRAAPLALELESRGTLDEDGFRLDARWVRASGAPAYAAARGARIDYEGTAYRLVEPLFGLMGAVGRLNAAAGEPERYARFAELKAMLPEDLEGAVRADGYVEGLRIAYAAGFSLQFDAADQAFTFDPVLFSRHATIEAGEGAVLDEADDSLLPPRVQARFIQRFRGADAVRSAYLVGDGGIVYLDPDLKSALGVVRRAQRADAATRRAFVRNPRRFVREALETDEASDAAAALDLLFVETEQFSARVTGIEVWRKPVLPWIVPSPTSWLPERFGLRVGEEPDAVSLELSPEQARVALAAVEAAVACGAETVRVQGERGDIELPANARVIETLKDLTALGEPRGAAEKIEPTENSGRYFLQVRDNLEAVGFAPLTAPAAAAAEPPPEPPAALRSTLKPHQLEGFAWLVQAWRAGLPGVLLADDMGLGKTLQALSFLAWLRGEAHERRPALVVAPTGLLANWAEEIDRHLAPGALGGLVRAYGSGLAGLRTGAGRDIALGGSRLDPDRWAHAGVVLTTYETLRDYQFSFARTPFSVVVFDEVQKLKNPASQVTAAARPLNARLQIAMTGTPVENRLQDLWSILDVAHPGLLGSSRDFEREYAGADIAKLQRLNDRLTKPQDGRPAVMLRRMKHGHVEGLPDKTVVTYGDKPGDPPMPAAQAGAYAEVVGRAVAARGAGADRGRMLEVLHQLRSVSLHPRPPETGAADFDAYAADSARLKQLFVILDGIAARGEKVLVFCESLAMQAQLAVHLRRRYRLDHPVACISGEVAGDKRQAAVRAFQARPPGFDVMVLSPKAGGVGLTLTAANHVVHLSRWWNPAVEDQSTDRVHRIGQTRPVTVHLPLAVHPAPALRDTSFDLKLDALMERKRRLSRDLLAPPESEGDLSGLFDDVTVASTPKPPSSSPNELAITPPPASSQTSEVQSGLAYSGGTARAPMTLPKAEVQPASRREGTAQWPTRVQFRPGSERDWRIFSGPLEGEACVSALLRDPYAGSRPENRRAVADFFRRMAVWTPLPTEVQVACWDAESAAGPYAAETNREQIADFQRAWSTLTVQPPPKLSIRPKSKRSGYKFHDRSLEVRMRSGSALVWDLGNGIDGLMQLDRECTVSVHRLMVQ